MKRPAALKLRILSLTISTIIAVSAADLLARGTPPKPLVLSVPGIPGSIHEPASREAFREVMKAQDSVSRACIESRRDFEASSEFQKALEDARQARVEYDRARSEVIRGMQQRPEYKAAQINLWKAQQELDNLRSKKSTPAAIAQAAAELLRIRKDLTRIENELLAEDETLKLKQYNAIDSEAMVAGMRRNFEETITNDPRYRAAKAALDSARQRLAEIGR